MLRPRALPRGGLITVVAPAGPPDPDRLARGVQELRAAGYAVRCCAGVRRRLGYLAGSDEERAAELMAQFSDPAVHAIVCARGGYGSQRILELLDYELIARRPKILIGYSDITALLLAIHARSGLVVFHGPMVACELAGDWLSRERAHSWRLLVDPDARTVYRARAPWILGPRGGVRRGRLLGGCLSLLTTLSGTPFQPDTRGALLFFEEVGEDPYRVDRALQHLRHAGWFDGVAAVLVGRMADCVPRDQEPSLSLEEVFAGVFGPLGVPVIAGYGFGHQGENPIIPIGCQAEVDLASGLLRICEAAVRAPGAGRGPASRSVRD